MAFQDNAELNLLPYAVPQMPELQAGQRIIVVDFRAYYVWASQHWGRRFFPHEATTISVFDRDAGQWVAYKSWYFSDSCDVRVSDTHTIDDVGGMEKHRSLPNSVSICFKAKSIDAS